MSRFTGVAWFVYEAAHHCEQHAIERFGFDALSDGSARDSEGNSVGACAPWDECNDDAYCDECLYEGISSREQEHRAYAKDAQRYYEETDRLRH